MIEVYIVLDESGAKGKSNKNEQSEGEFGVAAGFMCSANGFEYFKEVARDIAKQADFQGSKRHVADMKTEQIDEVRKRFFYFMNRFGVYWSYSASYVNGFYKFNDFEEKPRLLHSTLIVVLLIKLLSRVKARHPGNPVKLNIITDLLQESTVKLIKKEFDEIIALFINGEHSRPISRFNKLDNKVEHAISSLKIDAETYKSVHIPELVYEITCEVTDITFMADILSNSVYRHINNKLNLTTPRSFKLESTNAISGHPLEHTCFGASDETTLSFSDLLFFYRGSNES